MVFADKMHDVIRVLENDGVIVYPTDTIWGLGCSVFSQKGIESIHTIKGRRSNKPFVVLCSSIKMAKSYVESMHPRIETLLFYHSQPLTIVYPQARELPEFAIAEDGSVAIRITQDEFSKTIIDLLGNPIVSTSANVSGEPFPKSFDDINPNILNQADYVCFHKRHIKANTGPSVVASYDKKGELIFLRT
jgi:L-threonylcarbamoyladenylate synthase